MSVWTTKASVRDRDYIVLKHTLRGVNYVVSGIRFRHGYAVVEKGSKTYLTLMKIPILKKAKEYPLTFLRKLFFITRPIDVKLVYGADVYSKYMKLLNSELNQETQEKKIVEEVKHIQEKKLCSYRTDVSGGEVLCKKDALEVSPSGYCVRHVLKDSKLADLGIQVPTFIPKKDKVKVSEKVIEQLEALKKEGKLNG